MVVVVVVVIVWLGVEGVMMANLWRGCACTIPYRYYAVLYPESTDGEKDTV